MAHVLVTFAPNLLSSGGKSYTPRACGRQRADGVWEGWIEFVPDDRTAVVRSSRESTQPNLTDLEYWATGLTRVYLEGAFRRALRPVAPRRATPVSETPAYEEPASTSAPATPRSEPVDPFVLYREGEDVLRQALLTRDRDALCAIVRAHELDGGLHANLDCLSEAELIAYVIAATRLRTVA